MTVSINNAIPKWQYTTYWYQGHCRIDDGICRYQVMFTESNRINGFPDVTALEKVTAERIQREPTTAEELWESLFLSVELESYAITVRCMSDKHGLLEVGE